MLCDKPGRVVADGVGVIVTFLGRFYSSIIPGERVRFVETSRTCDSAIEPVESPLQRPIMLGAVRCDMRRHVPLSGHVRSIAGHPQDLRDGNAAVVELAVIPIVAKVPYRHPPHIRLMRIKPGHK